MGLITEAGSGKWSTTAVGALSERPSTSADGRSPSAPTREACQIVGSWKTLLNGLLLQPHSASLRDKSRI